MAKKRKITLVNIRQIRKYLASKITEIDNLESGEITTADIEKLKLIRSYVDILIKAVAVEGVHSPALELNTRTEIIIR